MPLNEWIFHLDYKYTSFEFQCDIIISSIGEKQFPTDNVLARGNLAKKMAVEGGDKLVKYLADPNLKWARGKSFVTESFDLGKGEGRPSHIVHFCLPKEYAGGETYQVTHLKIARMYFGITGLESDSDLHFGEFVKDCE